MSDPLSLVRQATITGTPVSYSDGNYIFGDHKFHETTKTFFKRTLKSNDYFYTLKDIIFFLENAEVSVAEYRRKVVENRITAVVEQDRQSLKNYLTGSIDTCPQIDLNAAAIFAKSAVATASNPEVNETRQLSLEKIEEQRQRHAALIEKTALNSKIQSSDQSGVSTDKLEELRNLRRSQKRKAGQAAGEEEEDVLIDKAYIEADRQNLARLRADETPSHTRSTVLTASDTDFQSALRLFNEKILRPKDAHHHSAHKQPSAPSSAVPLAQTGSKATSEKSSKDRKEGKEGKDGPKGDALPSSAAPAVRSQFLPPIIIVPSAVTSCITGLNARDFLIDGVYIPVEAKRDSGAKREKEQSISRPAASERDSHQVYKIIDDPLKLTSAEWDRVVAVFATGQLWQFKGWKYSSPVDLFHHVLGVHVALDDRAVNPTVQSWNCKLLKVNEFKQHLNAGAAKEFWMYLDDFVRLKKPHLRHMQQQAALPHSTPAVKFSSR